MLALSDKERPPQIQADELRSQVLALIRSVILYRSQEKENDDDLP